MNKRERSELLKSLSRPPKRQYLEIKTSKQEKEYIRSLKEWERQGKINCEYMIIGATFPKQIRITKNLTQTDAG